MPSTEVHDEWMSKNHPRCPVCSGVCTKITGLQALIHQRRRWNACKATDTRARGRPRKVDTLASQETQATSGLEYGRPATFDSAYNHSMEIRKATCPKPRSLPTQNVVYPDTPENNTFYRLTRKGYPPLNPKHENRHPRTKTTEMPVRQRCRD